MNLSSFIDGYNYGGASGLTSFDLVANTPEASTIVLFGTGILLMGLMGFRKWKGLLCRS